MNGDAISHNPHRGFEALLPDLQINHLEQRQPDHDCADDDSIPRHRIIADMPCDPRGRRDHEAEQQADPVFPVR